MNNAHLTIHLRSFVTLTWKTRLLTMWFSCSMILEVIYIIMSETKRINIYSIWSRAKLTTKWWDANFVSCVEIVTWFIFSKILKWDNRRYFQTTIRKFTSKHILWKIEKATILKIIKSIFYIEEKRLLKTSTYIAWY